MNFTSVAGRMLGLGLLLSWAAAGAQEADEWPRQMDSAGWTVVMYQPQVESFKVPNLEARAAVSLKGPDMLEPQFGAVWLSCTVSADHEVRMVNLIDLKVTDTRFPGLTGIQVEKLIAYLEAEIPTWKLDIELDRLLADLEGADVAGSKADQLNNDPPAIYFRTEPTVLVIVDGKPITREIEGSTYKYVANTPYFMIDDGFGTCYLKGGQFWYSAPKVEGDWQSVASVPAEVTQLAQKAQAAAQSAAPEPDSGVPVITSPPKVIVSTRPAELLLSDGTPEWVSVEGTGLVYVKNSENDILKDLETQQTYILIAGRWYRSSSLEKGPWKHVPPDQVPSEFARIPAESDMASVRASVPGTPEAHAAVLESSIPETAAVDRTKTITVEYDGEPKFDPIEGTNMKYAVNTAKSVIQIGGTYYCCEEAVWFVAAAPKGPWKVATSVPKDVQDIPASSPLYNTKYVQVYDTTTEVVYVAYTPSYCGAYYYGGCMVYGTGYPYYPPYPALYYYPHPVTYGFGVHYNPWTGWGFTFGVSYGWLNISFSTGGYYGGYWGAGGYHAGYRHGYAHGYYNGRRAGFAAGYRAGQRNPSGGRASLYQNRNGVQGSQPRPSTQPARGTSGAGARPSTRPAGGQTAARPATGTSPRASTQPATGGTRTPKATGTANNVYADKNGNVYRNEGGQWQQRDNSKGSWKPTGGTSGPTAANRASTTNRSSPSSTQSLNRSQQSRQTGAQRSQSYSSGRARGGGGGGRRR